MQNNNENQCDIGMIGLGVMGRNLLLNIAEHGFSGAGYDMDATKVECLNKESHQYNVHAAKTLSDFIYLLKKPRVIMLLVPAGKPVDTVISELLPHLQQGDLIIDAGNSHFTDTNRRLLALQTQGIQFLGIGISGGEEGARHGPSIMPGGSKLAYELVRPILEAVAAKVNHEACVTYLGTGSAGHYVKMVHNGIEYGIMQLIAETYDLMKRGIGLSNQQLFHVYSEWNQSELNSYLLEITSHIFNKKDDYTHEALIDEITSVAKQNGTGMWTSQSAMELQLPIPSIDIAVTMRDLSVLMTEREQAAHLYQRRIPEFNKNISVFISQLKEALYTATLMVYAQGMSLLTVASDKYAYQLNLAAVAKIWRGGCIIRARLLEDIYRAYQANKDLKNILLDKNISQLIGQRQENLRHIIIHASHAGIAIPAFMSTLSYLDALRSTWSPANLIQAQRDYFGAHTYQRVDREGVFHTEWS